MTVVLHGSVLRVLWPSRVSSCLNASQEVDNRRTDWRTR